MSMRVRNILSRAGFELLPSEMFHSSTIASQIEKTRELSFNPVALNAEQTRGPPSIIELTTAFSSEQAAEQVIKNTQQC